MKSYKYILLFILFCTVFLVFDFNYSSVGRAVSVVNVSIASVASINFTVNAINFGAGSVSVNSSNATIDTRGTVIAGNWTPINDGFIVENIGNINLSIYLKANQTAQSFLGGTNPGYYYMFNNFESNSCTNNASAINSWIFVNTSGLGDKICNNMQYLLPVNSLRIDVRLVVPSDAIIGKRSDIFTVTGVGS